MAVNFPDAPSNGDSFSVNDTTYVYNATAGYWDITSTVQASASTGTNAPSNPSAGDFWFDPSSLTTYIYYSDGTSSQWIPANSVGARGAPGPGYPTSYYSVDYTSTTTGNVVFNSSSTPTLPSYTVGKVNAWVNGVLRSDIDATDGSNVEISLSTGDEVQIINFGDTDVLDPTASSNDHTTYTTLSSLIDTVQSNVTSAGSGVAVYATPDLLPLTGTDAGEQAYVNSTNRLYISNGTGWYSIGLVNTNPAITSVQDASAGTTPFTLAIDGSATVITITASDPEDVPLTYSYAVTSGSLTNGGGTTATVVQGTGANTNQFTITPTTTEAYAGTFDLTFTTSDGINQASSVNNFTLNFITSIANSNYTTLLATATGTSDNNNITDASTNNHSITVNGDAHAGTFSPYRSGGYATSFSRSASSELEIASMPAIGSGDCSIEVWCKIDSQAWNGIISRGAYNSSGTFSLSSRSGDTELTLIWSGTIYTTSGANINAGEWKWVQVIRSSGTVTIYVNGSSVGSWSNSANVSSTSNYIIGRVDSSDYFGGDLRDLRISTNAQSSSNGSEKLATDSNTTFLSCHLPYLSYATSSVASNTYSSISGTIETVSNSPYDYTEYSATDHGGSVYFDGSGDTINTYHASNLQLGASSAFTLEFWFYANGTSSDYQSLFSTYSGSSVTDAGQSARLIFNTSNNLFILTDGSSNFLQITKDVPQNVWNHFCWTRDASNNHKFYFNGEQIGTSTTNTNFQTDWWYFGRRQFNGDQDFTGYISDISLIKGSVTRTSAFTPPTAPLSSTGTSFHIKGTDASIIDKSQGTNLLIDGTTITGVSTGSKYSKAIKNTAASSAIKVCTPSEFNMRTNDDFTIEFWFKVDPTSSYSATNYPKYILQIQYGGIVFGIWANPSTTKIEGNGARTDGSSYITWSSSMFTSYTPNQWHHYALSFDKSNTTAKWFLDGSVYHTDTSYDDPSTSVTNSNGTYMVSLFGETGTVNSNTTFIGSIEDFRFSQFTRYTGNFTPPTAPLEG